MEIETAYQLQGALRAKAWTVRSWAIAHGYNPRTVLHCISTFAPHQHCLPKRRLSKAIMADLSIALSVSLMRARLQMHIYGLGINDPLNGVWLPRSKAYEGHFTTPKAPPHSRIHRYNYEMWVGQLAQVRDKKLFVDRLRIIKMKLNHGTHPDKILEKKDPT
ncbi:hypothetical protein [Photobacterium nomapromontoriensis]|uniref:hypothetical protein n=1 Tax=Photobacterium nomapromontoriensis TaxID=2910237 RepID=UPI003D09FD3A